MVYNPRFKRNIKISMFSKLAKRFLHIAEYVALFPNVMLGIHKDHFYAYWLEPVNNEYTKEHMEIYYVGNEVQIRMNLNHLERKKL